MVVVVVVNGNRRGEFEKVKGHGDWRGVRMKGLICAPVA